jgi:small subunit ribosomal protein S20
MPIKKAALKRMRADKKLHERNKRVLNDLKTRTKRIRDLIAQKKKDQAISLLPNIASRLDKAAKRKIIHRNKASRALSRLQKAVKSIA